MLEEKALVARLQDPQQREAAFADLVRTHQRMLYYHLRRMVQDHDDADDLLQNTFLKAWRALDNFRAEASLKTWLYRIATNEALTLLQQRKRRDFSDVEDIEDDLRHSHQDGLAADGDEIRLRLDRAIQNLPERQRMVFMLRYFDEMKYEEIAGVLGVTAGALKASFHHAVQKIEKQLRQGLLAG